MQEAHDALQRAEREFKEEGKAQSTRDLAYIADRTATSAAAIANTSRAIHDRQMALADLEQAKNRFAAMMRERLDKAKTQISEAEARAASERQARVEADKRIEGMLGQLEQKGVKTEKSDRGLVVTISGEVLFPSGKSTLLSTAQQRLDQVAEALKNADGRSIMIVGHTDSQGSEDVNNRLSEARASSVKKYLAQKGVPAERIQSQGMGESQPIASNDTPEGRANNRRVEIILQDVQEEMLAPEETPTKQPKMKEPGPSKPKAKEPGTKEPGTKEPGAKQPETKGPETKGHETKEHGGKQPPAKEPGP
jgi:outer membrane protein OmpA-like peptidoglycan-associated protein